MSKNISRLFKGDLTQSLLKSILDYDLSTGEFYWTNCPSSNISSGCRAGRTDSQGYRKIKILGGDFRAHRLAWLYVYGEFPKFAIDHIDGNPCNNSINNLRDGSNGVNQQNVRRAQANNKSGFLGVHKNHDRNTYKATVSVKGKLKNIGSFKTAKEAHEAYLNAKRQLHAGCAI